ncbi:CvpA family protein [Oceanivirga salmonicida]|uniref:CvpA family protein n=1 Tax=Oceanivirga salmonicida TaxID=1769291 RepID=UPI000832C80A|nr:CvpA family protein [Oceanivirga salmonicida]
MIYDIVFGIILIGMFFTGLKKGMVYMVFGLVKLLVAILITPIFVGTTYSYIKNYNLPINSNVVAYILTFVIIVVLITIGQYLLEKFLGVIGLGVFNKVLGGILGIAEAYILTMIIIVTSLFLKDYNVFINEQINKSQIAYYLSLYTKEANEVFPKVIKEKLDEFYIKNKKIDITNKVLNKIYKDN